MLHYLLKDSEIDQLSFFSGKGYLTPYLNMCPLETLVTDRHTGELKDVYKPLKPELKNHLRTIGKR